MADEERRFSFHGRGGTLFGIQAVNILFALITLGVFSFWARVRTRRYVIGAMEFLGDRFAYHGTGQELFRGFLKAAIIFIIPYLVLQKLPGILGAGTPVVFVCGLLAAVLLIVFIPVAIVGSTRYRLSRTSWRGVRFSFRGSWVPYARIFWPGAILTAITLGVYFPYYMIKRRRYVMENSYFGNRRFSFDGRGGDLVGRFLLSAILTPFTLGLSWFWYGVFSYRYACARTSFGEARFGSTVTFGGVLLLRIINSLIVLFTLGLGWPWAKVRRHRYYLENLHLEGELDAEAVMQEAQAAQATGEELADFLDLDLEIG